MRLEPESGGLLLALTPNKAKQTQTHRHTDTQTHRHTDTQTHRHTDTQTHRHTDTQTHRHTDTQTHRHTDTQTCDALRSSNAKLELTAKPLFRRVVAALYHAVRRGYRRNGQPVPGRILHPHRCRSSSAEKALKGWSGWVSKSALERSDCGDAPLSHVTAHTRVFHNM